MLGSSEASALITQFIAPRASDLFALRNPLFAELSKRKKVKTGPMDYYQVPINYRESDNMGAINPDGSQLVSLNPQPQLKSAIYQWKTYYNSINFTQDDFNRNGVQRESLEDLITTKINLSLNSFTRKLSQDFYASNASNLFAFEGLADMVGNTTYAGVDPTSTTNWASLVDTTTKAITYNNLSEKLTTLADYYGQHNMADDTGNDMKPDIILTNGYVFQKYKSANQLLQRFVEEKDMQSGFTSISIDGIKMYQDAFCPGSKNSSIADNLLYILSTQSFDFIVRFGFGSEVESPVNFEGTIPNAPFKSWTMYHTGALVCKNRRVNAVMKTLQS